MGLSGPFICVSCQTTILKEQKDLSAVVLSFVREIYLWKISVDQILKFVYLKQDGVILTSHISCSPSEVS